MNTKLFGILAAAGALALAAGCTSSSGDDDGSGGSGGGSGGSGNSGGSDGGSGGSDGGSGGSTGGTGGTSGGVCADAEICGGANPQSNECATCAGDATTGTGACTTEAEDCVNDLGDDMPAGCLGCGEWLTDDTGAALCDSSGDIVDALYACVCDECG